MAGEVGKGRGDEDEASSPGLHLAYGVGKRL